MFHFPSFASYTYVFSVWYLAYTRWVSPFRNLRITGYLPPPRSLSQAITSFIASDCQGIHHMHLITWLYNPKQSIDPTSRSFNVTVWSTVYLNTVQLQSKFTYQNAWFSLIASNSSISQQLLALISTSMNNLFQLKYNLLMISLAFVRSRCCDKSQRLISINLLSSLIYQETYYKEQLVVDSYRSPIFR